VSTDYDHLLTELTDAKTQAEHALDQEREDIKQSLRERIYTLKELVHQETTQAESLLGPLVRRGQTTMTGGYGGSGKSTMNMEMVQAIVTGQDFLGWEGEGERALIGDWEQGMSVAQRRVYEAFTGHAVGNHNILDLVADMDFPAFWERVKIFDWQEGADLSSASPAYDVLEEEIEKFRPDVVLIDPIYKLFLGQNLNEQEVVSGFVKQVGTLRTKYNFALLLPAHPRKPGQLGGSLSMHDLYGAAVWSWWAENVVMIQREEGNRTKMKWEKDRMGQAPVGDKWTLTFEHGRGFRRSIDEADEKRSATKEIWKFLQRIELKGVWFTRHELAEALGLTQDAVDKATKRMDNRKAMDGSEFPGLVSEERHGKRRYSYLPTGDAVVIDEFKKSMGATEEFQF
jgi:hypothetical protein